MTNLFYPDYLSYPD